MTKIHLVLKPDMMTERDPITGAYVQKKLCPLGFARVYDPSKKNWESIRKTQLDWAYMRGWSEVQGIIHADTYDYNPAGRWVKTASGPAPLQPIVVDNVALTGFKVVQSVSRSSNENKVWRILDPRGFQLEIATDNFEDVLMQHDILKGDIQGKFIWEIANNRKPLLKPA